MLFRIKHPFFAARLFAAVLAISAISLTQVAIASPPAVEAMANKARKAYDAADFTEAARLYYQAWQADAARGIWLYSAARSAQKAGIWDDAAEWYKKFIAAPGDGEEKLAAARTNLVEVQKERVKVLLRKAEQASSPALGYKHARAAAEVALDDGGIWLQAAELADKSAMTAEAVFCYSRVIRFTGAGSAEAQVASRRLRALGATVPTAAPAAAARRAPPQPPVVDAEAPPVVASAREVRTEKINDVATEAPVHPKPLPAGVIARAAAEERPGIGAPVTAACMGAAALAGGIGVLVSAGNDADLLKAQTFGYLASNPGQIPMTYADANSRADQIANKRLLGWSLAVVGCAATVGGVIWAVLRSGDAPSTQAGFLPVSGGGVLLVGGSW